MRAARAICKRKIESAPNLTIHPAHRRREL
jgi:hypothetical protein